MRLPVALLAMAACSHGDPAPKPSAPLPWAPNHGWMVDVKHLVTAIGDDWTSTKVRLTRWERKSFGDPWHRVGEPWDGVIGTSGMGWGDGLHGNGAPSGLDGPVKREGDRRAPAGAFEVATVFGYDEDNRSIADHPYMHLTDATECVDDPRSAAYNTIVEHTGSADWTSSEHMRRDDDLYSLGAVIEHNPQNVRGDGSCIFFHVWSGPDSTTVGCTAMDKQKLASMLSWLGDDSLFVQLPRAEYRAVQDHWGLPPQ